MHTMLEKTHWKARNDTEKKSHQERTSGANKRLAQWRVTWLIEHAASHQLLWCIDGFVLPNPPLRQAPKRCRSSASFGSRRAARLSGGHRAPPSPVDPKSRHRPPVPTL